MGASQHLVVFGHNGDVAHGGGHAFFNRGEGAALVAPHRKGARVHVGDFPVFGELLVGRFADGLQAVELCLALVLFEVYKAEREKQALHVAFGGFFLDRRIVHGFAVAVDHESCILGVRLVANGFFGSGGVARIGNAQVFVCKAYNACSRHQQCDQDFFHFPLNRNYTRQFCSTLFNWAMRDFSSSVPW